MRPVFQLWGKKRGHRMRGWWFVGSLGEAMFFAGICLLGVLSLAVVVGWQIVSPETHARPIGFGFWLLVITSASFIGIGGAGFIYRVMRVAISDERRGAIVESDGIPNLILGEAAELPKAPSMVPSLQPYTDSPGVKLAYRLPSEQREAAALILRGVFALAWNALAIVLIVILATSFLKGRTEWSLLVFLPFFLGVGYWAARAFLPKFQRAMGIGQTTVEIDALPMFAGQDYRLHVVQYGRLALKKLSIALVCQEEATYHHGTDIRTERHTIVELPIFVQGRCRIDYGRPLEIECQFRLPTDAMHSFQSPHNAVIWKVIVEGEANRWPSYCRSFPVVVYPVRYRRTAKGSLRS